MDGFYLSTDTKEEYEWKWMEILIPSEIMSRKVATTFRRGVSIVSNSKALPKDVSASEIRKSFLDFFCEDNGHLHVSSSPVFSLVDPTLAFVNAGMNQFKNVFLGLVEPASKKVANSQKCIRIGGKHNDLSQVGQDGTHHSFFEMLGNWSFGDYFKKEACDMSWNLLVNVYGIPRDRLYFTYFGGDENLGLDPDFEVREIWRELGIKESHILPFGIKDNFWEMGATGPCGVCTEIHYDHVPGRKEAGHLVNSDKGEVSELWNVVFTQYNRREDGRLESLNKHFVDTGMGYERLVAVLQGKTSNYDTDLFFPLFEAIKKHSGHGGYTGKYGKGEIDCEYRILADHGRMIAVALSDGMIPNHQNKVRTIIRKALSVCENAFKRDYNLLIDVTRYAADTLSDAYPEIGKNLSKVQYLIEQENESLKTLQKNATKTWKKHFENHSNINVSDVMEAPKLLEGMNFVKKRLEKSDERVLSPENSWILFDTFGIPPKISEKLASSLGLEFDINSFKEYEEKTKKKTRSIQEKKLFSQFKVGAEIVDKLTQMKIESSKDYFVHDYWTDAGGKHNFSDQPATIRAIIRDGEFFQVLTPDDLAREGGLNVGIVLDRTQFLSSDFNRQSDMGTFSMENGIVFNVENVVKVKQWIIHYGTFKTFPSDARMSVREEGILELNQERRLGLMRNQTGLNLLKGCIRQNLKVTGEKYSMVQPDKFILTIMVYKEKLDLKGIIEAEMFINQIIRHDVSVLRKPMTHSQFQKVSNDVVFFPGISLLESEIPVFEVNSGYALIKEHCTGTHVLRTSHLEDFIITKSYKSGYCLQSIEGVTGPAAAAVRKADDRIQKDWMALKQELKINHSSYQEKRSELKKFTSSLSNSLEYSYVAKEQILKDAENIQVKLKV